MNAAKAIAAKYFQKTVSGTQKYLVASEFPKQVLQDQKKSTGTPLPSRQSLKKHKYHLHLPALTLPDALDLAATDCLREYNTYSIKHLKQLSTRLVNHLHERELLKEVFITVVLFLSI